MSISEFREVLLWCFVINYALLILWFLISIFWSFPYDLCAKWCKVSRERINELNFLALILYKAAVILFVLVPLIAMWIVKV
jgi:hypothetical protein